MNETVIRQCTAALAQSISVKNDVDAVTNGMALFSQVLVDINRLANAMERIAIAAEHLAAELT